MSSTREPFEPDYWYHVFNHARGGDSLFDSDFEFRLFLELIEKYIEPIANIYSYCLLPNHFHFLTQFKDVEIPPSFKKNDFSDFVSHQWGNVQNSFSKKKNYRTGGRGGYFCQSINRHLITSEEYLQMCVVYIHNNPVKHGFCKLPSDWKYSSYNAVVSDGFTKIKREEVLSWFGDKSNFIWFHKSNIAEIYAEKFKAE